MSETTATIELTSDQYREILACDYVAIREYERTDGSRFAIILGCGDEDEMKSLADTPEIVVLFNGVKVICQKAIAVRELVPPDDKV